MIEGLFYGVSVGTALGLAVGPSFFMLLSATVKGGASKGIYSAAGIVDSDIVMAILSLIGVGFVKSLQQYQSWVALVAGIVMIVAGLISLFLKSENSIFDDGDLRTEIGMYARTFFVNIINPFNWLFWIAVCGWIQIRGGGSLRWWVLVPAFVLEFGLNLLKIHAIEKYGRNYLMARIRWLKLTVSFSFIGFGIYLLSRCF